MFLVVDVIKDSKKMLEEKFIDTFRLGEFEILARHPERETYSMSPLEIVQWKT